MDPIFAGDVFATVALADSKTMRMTCSWHVATAFQVANSSVVSGKPIALVDDPKPAEGDDNTSAKRKQKMNTMFCEFKVDDATNTTIQANSIILVVDAAKVVHGEMGIDELRRLYVPRDSVEDGMWLASYGSMQRLCRLIASEIPSNEGDESQPSPPRGKDDTTSSSNKSHHDPLRNAFPFLAARMTDPNATAQRVVTVDEFQKLRNIYRDDIVAQLGGGPKGEVGRESLGDYCESVRLEAEKVILRIDEYVERLDAAIKESVEASILAASGRGDVGLSGSGGSGVDRLHQLLHANRTQQQAQSPTASNLLSLMNSSSINKTKPTSSSSAAAGGRSSEVFKDASQIFNVAWEVAGSLPKKNVKKADDADETPSQYAVPDVIKWLVELPDACHDAFGDEFVFKKESARTMLLKLKHLLRVFLEKDPQKRCDMKWKQAGDTDIGTHQYSFWEPDETKKDSDGDKYWLNTLRVRTIPPSLVLNSIAAVFIYTVDAKYCNCADMLACTSLDKSHRCDAPHPKNVAVFGPHGQPWKVTNWLLRVAHDVNQPLATSTAAAKSLSVFAPFIHDLMLGLSLLPQSPQVAFRGLGVPIADKFTLGTKVTLAPFTSTALDANVAKDFLGGGVGTFFLLRARTCIAISSFSWYPTQNEVLLTPFTELEVKQKTSRTLLQMLGCQYDIVTFIESNAHVEDEVEIQEVYESSQKLSEIYNAFVSRYIEGRVEVQGALRDNTDGKDGAENESRRSKLGDSQTESLIFSEMERELFQLQNHVLLLGGGGSGKTSATVGCLCKLACMANTIPLFVPLPSVTNLHFPDALDQHVHRLLGVRRQARELLESRNHKNFKVVLILDSLDEVNARRVPLGLLDNNPWCAQQHVILSCRPEYLTLNGVFPFGTVLHENPTVAQRRVSTMTLQPFIETDINAFIRHAVRQHCAAIDQEQQQQQSANAGISRLQDDEHIVSALSTEIESKVQALSDKALATLPCTLAMVVQVYLRFESFLDSEASEHKIIGRRHIMAAFLQGHLAQIQGIPGLSPQVALKGIKEVAWTMLTEGSWQLPLRTVLAQFEGIPAPVIRRGVLPHIPRRVEDDNDDSCAFSFWHKVVAEWLCATVLLENPDRACHIRREFSHDAESLESIMRAFAESLSTLPLPTINATINGLYPVACRVERRTPLLTKVLHVLAAVEYAPSLQRELLLVCNQCTELIDLISMDEGYESIAPLPEEEGDDDRAQLLTPQWLASLSRTTLFYEHLVPNSANTLRYVFLRFLSLFDPRIPDDDRETNSKGAVCRFDATADNEVVQSFASKGVPPDVAVRHCFTAFIFMTNVENCDTSTLAEHRQKPKAERRVSFEKYMWRVANQLDRKMSSTAPNTKEDEPPTDMEIKMHRALQPYLTGMDAAVIALPESDPHFVRGVAMDNALFDEHPEHGRKIKSKMTFPALTSVSVDVRSGLQFAKPSSTLMLLSSPAACELGKISFTTGSETEALLPRNTTFHILWHSAPRLQKVLPQLPIVVALMNDVTFKMTSAIASEKWRNLAQVFEQVGIKKECLEYLTLPAHRVTVAQKPSEEDEHKSAKDGGHDDAKQSMVPHGVTNGGVGPTSVKQVLQNWFVNGKRHIHIEVKKAASINDVDPSLVATSLAVDFFMTISHQKNVVPLLLDYDVNCRNSARGVLQNLSTKFAYTPYESKTYVAILDGFADSTTPDDHRQAVSKFLRHTTRWSGLQFVFLSSSSSAVASQANEDEKAKGENVISPEAVTPAPLTKRQPQSTVEIKRSQPAFTTFNTDLVESYEVYC